MFTFRVKSNSKSCSVARFTSDMAVEEEPGLINKLLIFYIVAHIKVIKNTRLYVGMQV